MKSLFTCCLLLLAYCCGMAQAAIKFHGTSINRVDKKGKKQGDWIFFDNAGNIVLSCRYDNDKIQGPEIFYERGDTAFVKFPADANRQTFIDYYNDTNYLGDFILEKDSTIRIETEDDISNNMRLVAFIKFYDRISLPPVYGFGQQKLYDYMIAGTIYSGWLMSKRIESVLTISSSGEVTNVEFTPGAFLSANDEAHLRWLFLSMPRWQPRFWRGEAVESKFNISQNNTVSYQSF